MCLFIKLFWATTPSYLMSLNKKTCLHSCRSMDVLQFVVPNVRTKVGKKTFRFSAPQTWNNLQSTLNPCCIEGLLKNMVILLQCMLSVCVILMYVTFFHCWCLDQVSLLQEISDLNMTNVSVCCFGNRRSEKYSLLAGTKYIISPSKYW